MGIEVAVVQGLGTGSHGAFRPQQPSDDDVRAELSRILSSPHLQTSARRRTFLRYIVEETLAGRAERLKGFSVAVAVFGRDETFDAQTDPVVRLEARRLRRDLDSYYVDAGSRDAVRITIPKGSYVPHFDWFARPQPEAVPDAEPPARPAGLPEAVPPAQPNPLPAAGRSGRSGRMLAAMALLAAALAALAWLLPSSQSPSAAGAGRDTARGPSVVVLPFEAQSAGDESRYLAEGISQELIGNLMRFPGFRLYSLPSGFERDVGAEPASLGRELALAYVVSGSVRAGPEAVRVAAQMYDAADGRVLWSAIYDRPLTPEALIAVQSELAGEIATALGQPYGIVNNDVGARLGTSAVSEMESYLCVLRAYVYRRTFSRQAFEPVLACLEETVRREPDYSDAWAMLGWLHLDAGRYEFYGVERLQEEYQVALAAATEAVRLEPRNVLALKALAAIEHYLGRYDEGERLAREALALNPHDPDTLAQLGWRLAVRGKFEEGIPLLKRAIERTVNPPGWYFHLVAVDLYLRGEFEEMQRTAERSALEGSGVSEALLAIAAAERGDRDAARAALARMATFGPISRDPAAYFRRHGATAEIVAALVAGLHKAERLAAAE